VSLESDLRSVLAGLSAVTALVGSGDAARIRWDEIDEDDDLPAICCQIDSDDQANDLGGRAGFAAASVTILCRAETRVGSRALAEAVRLNGTDPGTGLAGYAGTEFDAVLESMATVFDTRGFYDTLMDFTVTRAQVS